MVEMLPTPIPYHGEMVAPVWCGACRGLEHDPHRLLWLPHNPPSAVTGHQYSIHIGCFNAATDRRVRVSTELAREVEQAASGT